jgi:hypothetical protein
MVQKRILNIQMNKLLVLTYLRQAQIQNLCFVFKPTVTDDKDDSGSDDVKAHLEKIPQDESNSEDESN